ncbi:glycoside hydrolase family 28 protein [Bacteroides sp. 214]|uniref:rhamnogalacturonidase n=1 Tax=Bacteroides sp. 214 TaxID=2302935 RepID=UPI0013D028A1|nr:glycoside hydrolase family 28 protein [Bacteroides sp. 214]NDW11410.1 glycoside hydrolase family 28 protein [Bacteroides sp. 214]
MKNIFATIILIASTLCSLSATTAQNTFYNVKEYGAKGDGIHIDSDAINQAIEAAAQTGGGTVYIPAGKYLSYSIRLKSNISLYIDHGATIVAAKATEENGYDEAEPNEFNMYQDFGHSHWQNSLIWGIGLHDISIIGFGLIDGTEGLFRGANRAGAIRNANKAISLKECRNVTIRDISMLMCGHFALLATGVDNLTLDNLRVDTNRDAFDIDCCANVRVSNCYVNTLNDDAIVLKSSYGLGYAKDTENVTITNCQVSGYDPGTLLDGTFKRTITHAPDREGPTGRIKFGTESNGGFKNITISNCVFDRCRGLALETVDGGIIEDITINNIAMRDITNAPLFIRLGNRARGPKETTPVAKIRRVQISNVSVRNADTRYASIIAGLPGHLIEDVVLSNIHIEYKGGLSLQHAAEQPEELINNFFTRNEPIAPRDAYDVPEREKDYPEPATFGILPAYGLFVRHAKNIEVNNVTMRFIEEDTRPVAVLMDVENIDFRNFKADKAAVAPYFVLRGVNGFSVSDSKGLKDIKLDKVESKEISK